ncbi:MAG: 2,3-bisphosphoglycerate-independent phosphoglycerate mutase [Methanomicrobia archaeon]|nr:2,3-bisphosphoglycerate-independent phosphoglycerate mutase [Methanomicrobia archaeon]MCK4432746.1 2,3-bisphosphoglycerate-independent phosphoglycerate mutase [Methanomicrobia archaeon]
MKALFIILDGVGDRLWEGKTPLIAANKKNIDYLCENGINGVLHIIGRGIIPGSDTAHLALFGYDPSKYYRGRGTFEALGADFSLNKGDIAFRVNLGTVDNNLIIKDRRAGRDGYRLKELLESIDGMEIDGVKISAKHTTEHRGVVILRGKNLTNRISDIDPHETGVKVLRCNPLEKNAEFTASVVNKLVEKAYKIFADHEINKERKKKRKLPANYLLLRGAGIYEKIESFEDRYNIKGCCIAGGALYKGVAKYIGMDVIDVKGATGTVNTDLKAKAKAVFDNFDKYDFFFVHIKGTDSASHDGDFDLKKKMIERVDSEFISEIKDLDCIKLLTGDHSTPVRLARHSSDPVPILFWSEDVRKDNVKKFDEISCAEGGLGHVKGVDLMKIILDYMNKGEKFGE